MLISFFSKQVAEAKAGESGIGMISITNSQEIGLHREPGKPANLQPGWASVLRLEFDDVTPSIVRKFGHYQLMTIQQAMEVIEWVKSNEKKLDGIYVHCEAGISRSAAVAKFLGDYFDNRFDYEVVKFANDYVYQTLHYALTWYEQKENG